MDERQQLLFKRSALLDAAIGSQSRLAARLAKVDALRDELYVNPSKTTAPQRLRVWNITMIDEISAAREDVLQARDYFKRVNEIDQRLAQLPPAA